MEKSTLSVQGEEVQLGFMITKIDKERRLVTGIATADNIDHEGDIIDYAASQEAFKTWVGNIREMHGPKAVGKAVTSREVVVRDENGNEFNGFEVTAYISKGAQDTWEKVLDGTLGGFSVGGRVLEKVKEFHKAAGKVVSRIKKYILTELSVVDNPCNPVAQFTMIKGVGIAPESAVEVSAVFYCETDEIALTGDPDCPSCGETMQEIGFVESVEDFKADTVTKMIDSYELAKNTMVAGANMQEVSNLQNNNNDVNVENMELTADQKVGLMTKFMNFLTGSSTNTGSVQFYSNGVTTTSGTNATVEFTKTVTAENVVTEVQEETMEKNEEVTPETEAPAAVEAEEVAEVVEKSETPDIVALIEGLKTTILDELKKNVDQTIANPVGNDSASGWSAKLDLVSAGIQDLTGNVERMGKRLDDIEEKVNSMGAVKKSVDAQPAVEEEVEEVETITKSQSDDSGWGNIFIPQTVIDALGYRS